jgi:hypothetical protein
MVNKAAYQRFSLLWNAIEIEILYNPDYSEATKRVKGYRLAHLEVLSKDRVPLPMTETGYRSHFTAAQSIEDFDAPIEFVKSWLAEAEQSKKWKAHLKRVQQQNQLTLF